MALEPIEGMDFVQMRAGSFYVADITTSSLKVKIEGTNTVTIPSKRIAWVIFANAYGYPNDRVQLTSGSEVRGTVLTKRITIESELGSMALSSSDILALHFASNHDL